MTTTKTGQAPAILQLIATLYHQTNRALALLVRGYGLPLQHFWVLQLIHLQPAITQKEIAFRLGMSPGNITRILGKLEQAALVTREQHWREKHMRLTGAGQLLLRQIEPQRRELEELLLHRLTSQEKEQVAGLLQQLLQSTPGHQI